MEISTENSYPKHGLLILEAKGRFDTDSCESFLDVVTYFSKRNPNAIAYDFKDINILSMDGIRCLFRAHKLLENELIEDYLIIPTRPTIYRSFMNHGLHKLIFMDGVGNIIKRLSTPTPE